MHRIGCNGLVRGPAGRLLAWALGLGLAASFATAADLQNALLRVRFDAAQGALVVTDKRNGRVWTQQDTVATDSALASLRTRDPALFRPRLAGEQPAAARRLTLEAELPARNRAWAYCALPVRLQVELAADRPELTVAFEWDWQRPVATRALPVARAGEDLREAWYRPAFGVTERDALLLYPHSEGLLIPADRAAPGYLELGRSEVYTGQGPYLACLGMLAAPQGAGVLTIFETPELALCDLAAVRGAAWTNAVPIAGWRANQYRFDRPRRLRYCFAADGGYGALAQAYRAHAAAQGLPVSLAQKARGLPLLERIAGGPVFWIYGLGREVEQIAAALHADGVQAALLNLGTCFFAEHGVEPAATETAAAVRRLRDAGFAVSRYDQYRDCFPPDSEAEWPLQMNIEGYPQDCLIFGDTGARRKAWGNAFLLNPARGVALAQRRIDADLARQPYNARFLDTIGSVPFHEGEDFDPAKPLDTYGAFAARQTLCRQVTQRGLLLGTEAGIDQFMPWVSWYEGPMTMTRWAQLPVSWLPADPLTERYDINVGPAYRIPFYSLVYHGDALITWRWEDSFNHYPAHWQTKNLWSVLYGNPPLFMVNRDAFFRFRAEIAQTYRYVCDWTRRVAPRPLRAHRRVTPDGGVQESLFDGGLGVVVNFTAREVRLPDGQPVPARDYRTFTQDAAAGGWTGARTYAAPPVAPIRYPLQAPSLAATEDFEGGFGRFFNPAWDMRFRWRRELTSAPEEVLDGRVSFLGECPGPAILATTDAYHLPLQPNRTYELEFRFAAQNLTPGARPVVYLSALADIAGARRPTLQPWTLPADGRGQARLRATTGARADYSWFWALEGGGGRLILDDIRVHETTPDEQRGN